MKSIISAIFAGIVLAAATAVSTEAPEKEEFQAYDVGNGLIIYGVFDEGEAGEDLFNYDCSDTSIPPENGDGVIIETD